MSKKLTKSLKEINGNVLVAGSIIMFVGVWIEFTFGLGLIALGVVLMLAVLLADAT